MARVAWMAMVASVVSTLVLSACGDSKSDVADAPNAGSAGTSGAAAGSGGTDAAGSGAVGTGGTAGSSGDGTGGGSSGTGGLVRPDPASASQTEACLYLLHVACRKASFECYGLEAPEEPCPDLDIDCPDRYFSEGANVTVVDAIACADQWEEADCNDLARNVVPDCPLAGSKAPGEACMFGSQCSSFYCGQDGARMPRLGCGHCAALVGEGEACDYRTTVCGPGYTCQSGGCRPIPLVAPPLGAACEVYGECAPPNYCLQFPGQASKTCQPLPALGEECADVERCEGAAYCCSAGSACDTGGLCVPAPGEGDPCGYDVSRLECADGLHCDDRTGTDVCTGLIPAGEACNPNLIDPGCALGLFCYCTGTCETGTCQDRRYVGEPCGPPNTACAPGTECQAGVCAPTRLQGRADECL